MKVKSGKRWGRYRLGKRQKYTGPRVVDLPASVIIPFGSVDYLAPLSNCLRSVRWQEHVKPGNVEIVLVYLYRAPEHDRREETKRLHGLVDESHARLVQAQKLYDHFPLCLARNMGARAATKDTLVFVDADAVLDPEFLARSLLQRNALVTCWLSYLREGHPDISEKGLVRKLARTGEIRMSAYGGGIVAPRAVVEGIRGFDEVYDRAWGGDDNDMVDRLVESGLGWHNLSLSENIVNLHQYHPQNIYKKDPNVVANRKRYKTLKTVMRNPNKWGVP